MDVPTISVAVRLARGVLTAKLTHAEPIRAYCPDCRGTGRKRHATGTRCQRCRGAGHTVVGHTKR